MAPAIYDAVVVGSGVTGDWVARELTEAGLTVAVLEAGRKLDPALDYSEHKRPFDMPFHGRRRARRALAAEQPVQVNCYQCDEYTNHLFVKDTECPYTTPKDKPFEWIRGRHVGGKSITWGRQSYRLSDYDLKAASTASASACPASRTTCAWTKRWWTPGASRFSTSTARSRTTSGSWSRTWP